MTHHGLPVIPLSPIVQSFIICTNALTLATEKLAEAKKANLPVDALRSFMDTTKVESHRLNSLTRKMQTVDAATAIFWDSDALARQIAVIDSQLFNNCFLDKRSLLNKEHSNLAHLVDFHHYLTHIFAHQLVYWVELLNNNVAGAAVVPAVNPNKDSLVAHLVRVAYLLLHAYRDFSGFAAIMRALTLPEVKRLQKKLWHNCNSRTKDMFRDLAQLISPAKNYHAYHTCIRSKLQLNLIDDGMIAVPWIQPHLLSVRSIVEAYTAGDNEDQLLVLSTPGANKLNMEISLLELCQHSSFSSDFSLDEILTANGFYEIKTTKRASVAVSSKAIHIEGLRSAVIPVTNLQHLAGEQLIHHWLVSRVYLRKDQLINESTEVEPLKPGEIIAADVDDFEDILAAPIRYPSSRRTSLIPQQDTTDQQLEEEVVVEEVQDNESSSSSDDDAPAEETANDASIEHEVTQLEVTEPELLKVVKELTIEVPPSIQSNNSSKHKSRLSPSAPEFVPKFTQTVSSTTTTDEKWLGYPINEEDEVTTVDSEKWRGYPVPDDEVWTGYPRPASSQSETSEEWKGYQATKMEADWQRESALKVQQHEWQGYTLETLDEDELDSSTMMDGEFEKSRKRLLVQTTKTF
jgi:hypothetical protein